MLVTQRGCMNWLEESSTSLAPVQPRGSSFQGSLCCTGGDVAQGAAACVLSWVLLFPHKKPSGDDLVSLFPRAFLFKIKYLGPEASLVGQSVKNPPVMQETQVWSLGWDDSSGEGDGWRATVHGDTRGAPLSMGILQARIQEWVAMYSSRSFFLTLGLNPYLLCFLHWQLSPLPIAPPG